MKMRQFDIYLTLGAATFFLLLSFLPTQEASAQDMHYSQFYADPLRLNPSMTGNFNGNYRVGLNARNQWASVTVPYRTVSAYADFGLLKGAKKANWLGTGLRVLYDQAGDGQLATVEVGGLAAYHQGLSENLYVSIGAGLNFVQKSIDPSRLYWGSQWNDFQFDPNVGSGEGFQIETLTAMDAAVSATLSYQIGKASSAFLGGGVAHFNAPSDSFLGTDNSKRTRITANGGGIIQLATFGLEPAAYVSLERGAGEIIVGNNFTYGVKDSRSRELNKFYLGAWTRFRKNVDAVVAVAGMSNAKYRLLVSYDINMSSLRSVSGGRGGVEVSYVRVGAFPVDESRNRGRKGSPTFCPRF